MIYCIGDSHASIFSGNGDIIPNWYEINNKDTISYNTSKYFNACRIGPTTAYGLFMAKHRIDDVLQYVNKKNDQIMFCFGEVDCRTHILKEKHNLDSVVEKHVNKYIEVILYYKSLGYNMIIYGPNASWNINNPYSGPSIGTNIERNNITQKFNKYLKEKVIENDMKFVTMFYEMIDSDGNTGDWFDQCGIHIKTEKFQDIIEHFIKEKIIEK